MGPGAPYPHPNPSNAIGSFIIGVSPIGTISPFDVWTTILSQYANSSILTRLCTNMAQYIDQIENFDSFYDTIWNVDTAMGAGLDIWGRIVGVQRVLHVPVGTLYFGFEEAGLLSQPWNQAPWYSGADLTSNFSLSDSAFRTLIFAKALANISDGSIKGINQLLINLFPGRGGNAYIIDNGDMTMTYMFNFQLSAVEAAIMEQSGVFPTPTGVLANVVQNP